jgi:predicted dehydrogenase
MTGEGPINIGVVGAGGWASAFWQEGQNSPDVRLMATYDPARGRAEAFAQIYGGEVVDSLEDLLAHPQVDAVAVFTPNSSHREPAERAAAAGKHVFVDKPIANTVEDAVALIRTCEETGVRLMVGHSTRYHPSSRAIKRILESGQLGQLVMAEANKSHSGGTLLSSRDWRWHWSEAPGGPLMQLSVHLYDTLHYLFGPTKQVTAFAKNDLTASEIEDVFLTLLEFESGLLAYVGTNYIAPGVSYIRVYGRSGNLLSERGRLIHTQVLEDQAEEARELETSQEDVREAEMNEFARAIRTGTAPETDGKAGLLALGVVWAAIRSARGRRPVEVREAMGEAAEAVLADS